MFVHQNSQSPNLEATSHLEQLHSAVTREWLYDKQLVIFTIKDISRAAVDAAIQGFYDTMGAWPLDRPYLAINDFSAPRDALTPYVRERVEEVNKFRPELKGHIAIVTRWGVLAQLMQVYVATHPGIHRERRVFFHRDNALKWLIGLMNKAQSQTKTVVPQ